MSDNLEVANSLHRDIMNLCCNEFHAGTPNEKEQAAYGRGFKAARHEAAEIVQDYTSRIIASQQAAHDAEIAKLTADCNFLHSKNQRLDNMLSDLEATVSTANERIAYLEGLVALQADALKEFVSDSRDYIASGNKKLLRMVNDGEKAISATAETVQAFRDKLTEPLRREVAKLHNTLSDASAHLDYCGYGDSWERGCAGNLPTKISEALANTQATAQAYEQEVEARGAVKALESAMLAIDAMPIAVVGNSAATEDQILDLLRRCVETILATSKKG